MTLSTSTTSAALPGLVDGRVDLSTLRMALVHDFLYTYAGAEKVLNEMLEVVPHADVFAMFDFVPEGRRGFCGEEDSDVVPAEDAVCAEAAPEFSAVDADGGGEFGCFGV